MVKRCYFAKYSCFVGIFVTKDYWLNFTGGAANHVIHAVQRYPGVLRVASYSVFI